MVEFGRIRQSSEDLDAYVRRFNGRALDYCDPMAKDVLVDDSLHGMMEGYCVHLEFIFAVSCVMEAAMRRN